MNFDEYLHKMRSLCGNPTECKFPDYFFGNIRPWDYIQVIENGELNENDVVLECGAFHSYFCIYASQLVKKYICTDSFYWAERDYAKQENYQTPKEWCDYIEKKSNGKIVGEKADIRNLQYEDSSFDKVICISVIEHVQDDDKGMKEMMRVLKPGGLLLMTTEYNSTWEKPYSEADGSYYRVYNPSSINKLFSGLSIEIQKIHQLTPSSEIFTTIFAKIRKV